MPPTTSSAPPFDRPARWPATSTSTPCSRSAGRRWCCSGGQRPPTSSYWARRAGAASPACCWVRRPCRWRCTRPARSSCSAAPAAGAGPASGRIVVGADGSPTSDSALRFAFTWAQRHGRGLTVVRAWGSPAIFVDVPGSAKWEQVEKEEQAALSETLVPWRDRYPEVDVLEKSVLGNAAALLVGRVGDSRAPRGGQPRPRRVRRSPARLGQPRRPAPRPLSGRRGTALTTGRRLTSAPRRRARARCRPS